MYVNSLRSGMQAVQELMASIVHDGNPAFSGERGSCGMSLQVWEGALTLSEQRAWGSRKGPEQSEPQTLQPHLLVHP